MKPNCSYFFVIILISLSLFPTNIIPQELDITSFLKQIESGQKEQVASLIPGLKKNYPSSSALIYLEGLLTEDGEKACRIYQNLVDKYPNSKYADDAMYRIYSYFSAVDEPNKSEFFLKRLKNEYSQSPYLKLIDNVKFSAMNKISVKGKRTETSTKEKVVSKAKKFTVQAGAFTRKENALKLKSDFDKAGYSSEVIEKSVGGSLFHVVNVGNFASDEEAKSFLNIINPKFKLQGWVVRLE